METSKISNLQPLFCSRAALVKVESKMSDNPDADCQLLLRFNDGSMLPLMFSRDDIETLIASQKEKVEASISELMDATDDEATAE